MTNYIEEKVNFIRKTSKFELLNDGIGIKHWVFYDGDGCYIKGVKTEYDFDSVNEFEILGHPILLHHVLQAIEKVKKTGLLSPNLKRISEHQEVLMTLDRWDLTKPLSEQSSETISFLWDLLNK